MTTIPVGLQMYSLRDACAKDFLGTIRAVAEAGYEGVEFAGFFGQPADAVRQTAADAGLSIMGAHVAFDLLRGEHFAPTVAYHQALGNRRLVIPSLSQDLRGTPDACRRTIDELNALVEKLRPLGMETGYHAHFFDVEPMDDGGTATTAFDLIAQGTPADFIMQVDTGNCVQGGACPAAIMERYPQRAKQIHLKERYTKTAKWNLPLGSGDVPWARMFALAAAQGTEEYIVELESYWDDPIECIRQDRALLRQMGV